MNPTEKDWKIVSGITNDSAHIRILAEEEPGAEIQLLGMSSAAEYLAKNRQGFHRALLSAYAQSLRIFAQVAARRKHYDQ